MQQFASRGAPNKAARLTFIILWTKPAGSSEVVLNYHNDCTSTVALHVYLFSLCETHNYMCHIITHFKDTLFTACMWIYLMFRAKTSKDLNGLLHINSQYCKMRSTLNYYNMTIRFSRWHLLLSFTILTKATFVDGIRHAKYLWFWHRVGLKCLISRYYC